MFDGSLTTSRSMPAACIAARVFASRSAYSARLKFRFGSVMFYPHATAIRHQPLNGAFRGNMTERRLPRNPRAVLHDGGEGKRLARRILADAYRVRVREMVRRHRQVVRRRHALEHPPDQVVA